MQVETKQWKGFNKRTASNHHLRATLRNQIERCEILKDPDRIGST
jgi:hypothetical protein